MRAHSSLEMDVSDNAQVGDAYEATLNEFGTVDVLINNAALVTAFLTPTGKRTTLETTDEDWETMLGVNLMGPLRVTRRFIQPMIEKSARERHQRGEQRHPQLLTWGCLHGAASLVAGDALPGDQGGGGCDELLPR